MSGSAATTSNGSTSFQVANSRTSKRHNLSTIESSVTRLLVSTKHLLESLTQWARQEADDKFVSDAYVKLGNDFRAATRAFTSAGVDVSDIGDVPQALRIILEAALSEAPSQDNLDRFLPNIRNIIVTLLQSLKNKQLRAKAIAQDKHHQRKLTAEFIEPNIPAIVEPEKNVQSINVDKPSNLGHLSTSTISKDPSNNALAQLQKGSHIQRRASKRFSAYQYAKLTNSGPSSIRLSAIDSGNSNNHVPRIHNSKLDDENDKTNTKIDRTNKSKSPESDNIFIYLRIGNKTKKVSIKLPATFALLRLLFVEKFGYSPGSSSFPEIYVMDPINSVSYELEEHMLESDLKLGTLLCLHDTDVQANVMKELSSKVQLLSTGLDKLSSNISTQIRDAISSIEPTLVKVESQTSKESVSSRPSNMQTLQELNTVVHELKVLKKSNADYKLSVKDSIMDMKEKMKMVKECSFESSKSSNRAYMESSHLKLSEESDLLLTKVDDLQDTMEALRKDVVQRGVRVGEKQLKSTHKDISEAKKSLNMMLNYINKEKNTWKKIWEAELDKVCEEQQFFNLQDDLTQDLEEDIKKIEETFNLIEQCSVEQIKHGRRNRFMPHIPILEPGESLHSVKDTVLEEVEALIPNHESRLQAIERAERMREKEREMTKLDKFQEELGEFVDDKKLRSAGGIDEIERTRKLRDEENLKASFGII